MCERKIIAGISFSQRQQTSFALLMPAIQTEKSEEGEEDEFQIIRKNSEKFIAVLIVYLKFIKIHKNS